MLKTLSLVMLIAAILVGGFFAFNSYIYRQKQAPSAQVTEPYRGTLTGKFVCMKILQGAAEEMPQCPAGLMTDTGELYALDFNLLSQNHPDVVEGDRFVASGTITPIANISTNYWQKYGVVGIFSVTDSLKKL